MLRRKYIRYLLGLSGTVYLYSSVSNPSLASTIKLTNSISIPENKTDADIELIFDKFIVNTSNIDTSEKISIEFDLKIGNRVNITSINKEISKGSNNINISNINISTTEFRNKLNSTNKGESFETELIITISHKDLEDNVTINKLFTVNVTESEIPDIEKFDSYPIGEFPNSYVIEDNSVKDYIYIDDSKSLSNGQSLRFGQTSGGNYQFGEIDNGFKTHVYGNLPSIKPGEVTMSYYETNNSTGQWVRWMDNDKELFSVGTNNGELEYVSRNNKERMKGDNYVSPTYNEWRTYTITIDWETKTFDLLWKDITGSTSNVERTGLSFVDENIENITRVEFGRDQRVTDDGSGKMDCWYDNISFKPE